MTLESQQQQASSSSKTPPQGPGAAAKPLQGKSIMIVDDAADNRILISRYLEIAGACVKVVSDGLAATQMAFQHSFDVILMDIQMPQMDGYEALRILREKGYTKPIIALTAHAMKGDRETCLKASFNDHLSKPIDRVALINVILKQ